MIWTILAWILLYFTVGWAFTRLYDTDDFTWNLLVFLGWPTIAAGVLVLMALLLLFGAAYAIEETFYKLFHKGA